MSVGDRIRAWLERGAPERGAPDPGEPVVVADLTFHEGPRAQAILAAAGIDATWFEATTDGLHGTALTRGRVVVRQADAQRAAGLLDQAGFR